MFDISEIFDIPGFCKFRLASGVSGPWFPSVGVALPPTTKYSKKKCKLFHKRNLSFLSMSEIINSSKICLNGVELSKFFDHTALKPETTLESVEILCQEALEYDFASVCVNSSFVPKVYNMLRNSSVKVCGVVGFPLGSMCTEAKVFETQYCGANGASEIDMVINVGYIKSKMYNEYKADISKVVEACHGMNMICKVILEVCLLDEEEKVTACRLALEAGADFIKTSTGFSTGGAVVSDVTTLSSIAHDKGSKFKASGGIRDGRTAIDMICAGADRLGTSATVKVYKECETLLGEP